MQDSTPPVLYKYYAIEPWLPDLLAGNSLQFSSRTTFNDPMDSRPGFRWEVETQKGLAHAKDKVKRTGLAPAARVQLLQKLVRQHSKPRPFDKIDINTGFDQIGILSLAERWDNMLLWAHYGKMHRGICIGFRTGIDVFQEARRVLYSDDQPVILRPSDDDVTIVNKAFFTKARCWDYEEEWRILKYWFNKGVNGEELPAYVGSKWLTKDGNFLSKDIGAGRYHFSITAIESITIGMHASDDDLMLVKSSARAAGISATIYKVCLPNLKYFLQRKRA
jgi:hypothetical protein